MNWGRTIQQLVTDGADTVFFIDAATGRTWTRAAFHAAAKAAAAELLRRGVQHGDRLALLLPNGPEFAMLYFACLYAGIIAVPLNAQLHPSQLAQLINISRPAGLIYAASTQKTLQATQAYATGITTPLWQIDDNEAEDTLALWSLPSGDLTDEALFGEIHDEQIFSITFTSGTTGQPKGVCHRVGGLLAAARAFTKALGMNERTRIHHVLPMSYMAGFLNTLLCPFVCGGSILADRSFDAILTLNFWRQPIKYSANSFWLVPSMLGSLLKMDRDKAGAAWCRETRPLICVGTAPLPPAIQHDFEARYGTPLLESYGLSETLFVSSNLPGGGTPCSVGHVLPGVEVRSMDENGNPMPTGETGELWVRADFNMAGYWDAATQRPAMEEVAADGWFPTGDVGRMAANGELFITARKKDLIIRGGMNVSPRAVEDVLMEHSAVEEAAVIGLPHDFYGEQIIACVILKAAATPAALKTCCQAGLAAQSVPDHFLLMECLPRGVTGKIQKNELRTIAAAMLADSSPI